MITMVREPMLIEDKLFDVDIINDEIEQFNSIDFVTEDDTPLDNIFSEKQQRLLTEPLYSSTAELGELSHRPFFALANVGLFYAVHQPPLVPDVMLSLDVDVPQGDLWAKQNKAYFMWHFGKPPEVAIEIVSNKKGHEASDKLRDYARIRVTYYVIFDPQRLIQSDVIKVYELYRGGYRPLKPSHGRWSLSQIGLDLMLWTGRFEGTLTTWLRWSNPSGNVIPTGSERADAEAEARRLAEARIAELEEKLRQLTSPD